MNKEKAQVRAAAFKAAFPRTIPIMTGFLFLGGAYGIYARTEGFSAVLPIIMAAAIFAGSMEFVTVDLLTGVMAGAFDPLNALLLAIMVNARHIFYGLAMLDKYRAVEPKKRIYLIYGMCDESFSINCTADVPEGVDKGWFYFFVTLLNQAYWVSGAALGLLAVYCFKDVDVLTGAHGLPELIALVVITALHVWRRNMLLSIAAGTVVYMLMVNFVF